MSALRSEFEDPLPAAGRRPLRILLMPASYPPVLGGLQTAAHAIARELRTTGHEVRVVTNRYPRNLPNAEMLDGVRVERWPLFTPRWGQVRRGRFDLFAASLIYHPIAGRRLDHLIRAFRPDVVNVHFPDAQIPFVLGAREKHRFRLVASVHGHEVERFTEPYGSRTVGDDRNLRAVLRAADAVTACSTDLLDKVCLVEPSVRGKGVAIGNGIDPSRFADTTAHAHPRPYLFAMGRLTPKKGFDLLIEALATAGPPADGFDLLLAGEGEQGGRLQSLAARFGLADRVQFLGRVGPAEVVRLLNGCRLLVVPSRAEPFGIVALEGLAAGKPVVATRVGGMGPFLAGIAERLGAAGFIRLIDPAAAGIREGIVKCLTEAGSRESAIRARVASYARLHHSWSATAGCYKAAFLGPPSA